MAMAVGLCCDVVSTRRHVVVDALPLLRRFLAPDRRHTHCWLKLRKLSTLGNSGRKHLSVPPFRRCSGAFRKGRLVLDGFGQALGTVRAGGHGAALACPLPNALRSTCILLTCVTLTTYPWTGGVVSVGKRICAMAISQVEWRRLLSISLH